MAGRNNMLALPLPSSPNLSSALTQALREAISSHAGDNHHPDAFASDIAKLTQLRVSAGALEEHALALDAIYKYHAQLVFTATKLPSTLALALPWSQTFISTSVFAIGASSSSRNAAASFMQSMEGDSASSSGTAWTRSDAFGVICDGVAFVAHPSLAWERANVLFAAAALLSSLAIQQPRNDGTSIKTAVGFFQTSSAVLTHLVEQVMPALVLELRPTSPSHGLSPSRLRPLATLTLAQAQECFWQKAVSDGLKPATVAKLAKAVEDLYEQVLEEAKQAELEEGVEAFPRLWLNHVSVKRHHFGAAAQFRKSQDDLASSRYGDEISRLQFAESHVKSALAAAKKGLPTSTEAIAGDLKGLQGVIENNLKRARKDNDLIYLEPVTTSGSLTPIVGARMVQAKLPVEIARPIDCLRASEGTGDRSLPALGRPLFGALVPYGAHLAVSIYEDRKESWWRDNIESKRQELEAICKSTFDSLNLPGALDDLNKPAQSLVPPSLLSRCEDLIASGGVQRLHQLRSEVQRIAAYNSTTVQQARSILEEESAEDAAVRSQFADSRHWTRQTSGDAARGYWSRLDELEKTLQMAGESDAVVQGKMEQWETQWKVLEGGQTAIEADLPKVGGGQGTLLGTDFNEQEGAPAQGKLTASSPIVSTMRKGLENIDDALAELAALATETRSLIRSDDVREKVMHEVARLSASSSGGGGARLDELDLSPEMFEGLFEVEFKKYRTLEKEASALEAKLNQLLERLATDNESFRSQAASSKPSQSAIQSRVSQLEAASAKYNEVTSNLSEGLNFYNSLAAMLTEFKSGCQDWSRARKIDVQGLVQRFAGTSLELRDRSWEQPSSNAAAAAPSPSVASPKSASTTPRRSTRSTAGKTSTPSAANRGGSRLGAQKDAASNGSDDAADAREEEEALRLALGDDAGASDQTSQQQSQHQGQRQWGQWGGGAIQFGD